MIYKFGAGRILNQFITRMKIKFECQPGISGLKTILYFYPSEF